jgi:sarcosine oxidase gamma subunit
MLPRFRHRQPPKNADVSVSLSPAHSSPHRPLHPSLSLSLSPHPSSPYPVAMSGRDARDRAPRVKNRAPAAVQVSRTRGGSHVRFAGPRTWTVLADDIVLDHLGAAPSRGEREAGARYQGAQAAGAGSRGAHRVSGQEAHRVRGADQVFSGQYPLCVTMNLPG